METEAIAKNECARQPTKAEVARMRRQAAKNRALALKNLERRRQLLYRPIYDGEILSITDAKHYVIVKEMTGAGYGKPFPIAYAMTLDGNYLGDPKMAYRLVNKYGITAFKKRNIDSGCCSIGYNLAKKLWYGWSHRAISGFKKKRDAVRFAASVS